MELTGYLMAGEIAQYDIGEVAARCHKDGLKRVYVETFRDRFQVPAPELERARDGLRDAGIEACGAVCTVHYGTPSSSVTAYPCLTSERTRAELAEMMRIAASVFDHVLIDEYIWSHCECADCRAAKGEASWTDFRCAQMAQVCAEHVIGAARSVNPDVKLIYKVAATFEEWAAQGQDVAQLADLFDGVWVGTELGPFQETHSNPIRCQGAYRASVIMRWMRDATTGRLGGAWVMPIADSGYLRDAVFQTVAGGAQEVVLHPWGGMAEPYTWVFKGGVGQLPAVIAETEGLRRLAAIVEANPPRGLVAVRPVRAEPWVRGIGSDANVFDAVGQLGIPLVPVTSAPSEAEGWLLTLHAPDVTPTGDGPVVATDGLLATKDVPGALRLNVTSDVPRIYDYRGFTDPYDMPGRQRALPEAQAWDALEDGYGWHCSLRYEADPAMLAKLYSVPFGPPEMSNRPVMDAAPGTIDAIRDYALAPFGIRFRGPANVILQPLGNDYLLVHNTNAHAVRIGLEWFASAEIELVLPATAQASLDSIDAHTLVVLRR